MTFEQRQAHNALTFGNGYLTTGPCWQQHNTMPEINSYWKARIACGFPDESHDWEVVLHDLAMLAFEWNKLMESCGEPQRVLHDYVERTDELA